MRYQGLGHLKGQRRSKHETQQIPAPVAGSVGGGTAVMLPFPQQRRHNHSPSISLPWPDAEFGRPGGYRTGPDAPVPAVRATGAVQRLLQNLCGLYYGGTVFVDSELVIYVTDTSPAVI